MLWSLSLSLAVFVGYCTMYLVHHGLPESLSETFYHVKHRWKFSVCLMLMAALVFVPWIEASVRLDFLVFFACFSVFMVAASPQFRESFVSPIHYGSAGVMFVSALVWEVANGGLFLVLGAFAILGLIDRKRWVLWLEVGLFLELHFSLMLRVVEKSHLLFYP